MTNKPTHVLFITPALQAKIESMTPAEREELPSEIKHEYNRIPTSQADRGTWEGFKRFLGELREAARHDWRALWRGE